jgi:hypothetical protein
MRTNRIIPMAAAIGAILGARAPSASAQQYWHSEAGGGQLRLELLKPFLKETAEGVFVGAGVVEGSIRYRPTIYFEGDLPFARASREDFGGVTASSIRIGNPYVGIRIREEGKLVGARFGVRVPISSAGSGAGEEALGIGVLSDFDHWEAFAPKVFTARAAVELSKTSANGLLVGAAIGPSFMVSRNGGDPEVFGDYGARIGYDGPALYLAAELTGRLWATAEGGSLAERTVHQLGGVVELRPGRVRPQFRVRIPLDTDFRDAVGVIVGAGVRVVF